MAQAGTRPAAPAVARGEAPPEHDVEGPESAGGGDERKAAGLRPREALPEQRDAGDRERDPDEIACDGAT